MPPAAPPLASHALPPASSSSSSSSSDEEASAEAPSAPVPAAASAVPICVEQGAGTACRVRALEALALPPRQIWEILAHPHNAAVFRHVDRCTFRRLLADDGAGRRRLEVRHEAGWKFLAWGGTFSTRLAVVEDVSDPARLTTAFEVLAPGADGSAKDDGAAGGGGATEGEDGGAAGSAPERVGLRGGFAAAAAEASRRPAFIRRFTGRWTLTPRAGAGAGGAPGTDLLLEQELELGVWVPPPLNRLVGKIAARQVRRVLEDLRREAAAVAAGRGALEPYTAAVADLAIG
jgi:hypothetical protein